MTTRSYFPLGKAHSRAFCNRTEETEWLLGNIENAKHSLLMAPRRYGKSSLAERALAKSSLPWCMADFHLAVDEKDVEAIIINTVINLIGKSIGSVDKFSSSIKRYVKNLVPKITLGAKYARLEIVPVPGSTPAMNIAEALLLLEHLLAEKKKRAVVFLDEFQLVGIIAEGRGIEGAIRHAAQEMEHLSIIFSGSHRRLLATMFDDSKRPLYKLCRKRSLKRIEAKHYRPHLNKVARLAWKENLTDEVFDRIMALSERHPYYVNYLCDEVWASCDKLPTVKNVDQAWATILEEERSDIIKDFLELSDNQRRVLIHIANHGGENMTSHAVSNTINIPVSSVAQSIMMLDEKDVLERHDNGKYYILNPALKGVLIRAFF